MFLVIHDLTAKIGRLFCLAILFSGISLGSLVSQDLPELIPPNPDQAAINKFGDIPVSYSSGIISTDISIFNITAKNGFSLPISLNYHGGGVRVDEIASNVGLGWALSLGNSISASVRGAPDFSYNGVASSSIDTTLPDRDSFKPNGTTGQYASQVLLSDDYDLANNAAKNIVDTQFDFYHINFGARSSKFVIDQSRNAQTIPFEPIRIDVLTDQGEDYFVVYDENGNKFTYDVVETSKVTSSCGSKWDLSAEIFKDMPQVWYLRNITTTDGEQINFHYTEMPFWYSYDLSKTQTFDLAISQSPGGCYSDNYRTECDATMEIRKGQRLDRISFSNGEGEVLFNYSSRSDSGSPKISSIQVNFNNELIKDYDLTHTYFGSSNSDPDDDRLKLNSVVENVSHQRWEFNYYEQYIMPKRFSTSQDLWGYYNGKSNLGKGLIPSYSNSVYNVSYNGSDRSVNGNYSQTYALKSITYPTGGSSAFEYEPHSYYGEHYLTGQMGNHQVGGLRIKKITTDPGDNSPAMIKTFSYENPDLELQRSSGRLIDKPKYESRKRERIKMFINGGVSFDTYAFCDKITLSSSSYNTLGRSNGIGVIYEYVSESIGIGGEGGRNLYKYSTFIDFENNPQYSDLPDHILLYTGSNSLPTIYYSNYDLIELFNETTSFSFKRGLLLEKSVFNSSNSILSKEEYTYDFDYDLKEDVYNHPEGNDSFILNDIVIKQLYPEDQGMYIDNISEQPAVRLIPAVFLYVYGEITSAWVQLTQKKTTQYFSSGDQIVTTNYIYGNKTHQQVTEQSSVDSKGQTIITKNYFPDDIQGSGGLPGELLNNEELTAVNKMKATLNHQIASAIQTESYLGTNLLSRQRNNFKNWTGNFVAAESIEAAKGNNDLERKINFHSYDNYGNPTELSKEDGIHISYIWGYEGRYPVLQALGLSVSNLTSAVTTTIAAGWTSKPSNVQDLEGLLTVVGNMTTSLQKQIWKDFLGELESNLGDDVQFTALTYSLPFGTTSKTDSNGISSYYEYDEAGRVVVIRDNDSNIIKTFEYHYKEY